MKESVQARVVQGAGDLRIRSGELGAPGSGQPAGSEGRPACVTDAMARRADRAALIEAYFRQLPSEDQPRSAADVLGIIDEHWRVGQNRSPGQVNIRVFNPPVNADGAGWTDTTTTVVDIVNDDMPYLVGSVIGALSAAGVTVHRMLHPILAVDRAADGDLVNAAGGQAHDPTAPGAVLESWMHVLIDRVSGDDRARLIEDAVRRALSQVRAVVADGAALTGQAASAATELRTAISPGSAQEAAEAADFLYWLTAGHLTFLGYRRYQASSHDHEVLHPVAGTGLGILRDTAGNASSDVLAGLVGAPGHLLLTRAAAGSALTRNVPPFEVRVRILGNDGAVIGAHQFLGVLTPRAVNAEITTIPVLRLTAQAVLAALGASPNSYTGQQAMDVLSTYPRAELFWADSQLVVDIVGSVLQLSSRRRLRAFLQPDPFGRFVSVMVYLPRDRYTTASRLAMQQILLDAFHGTSIRYTARVGDSLLAALHFTVDIDPATAPAPDLAALNTALRGTIRSWEDRLVAAVVGGGDEELDTAGALSRYATAFDESYKENYDADDAVADLRLLDRLTGPDDLALRMTPAGESDAGDWRLKLYVRSGAVTLSRALPVLHSMGADVLDEKPFRVRRTDGSRSRIYDFGLRFPQPALGRGAASADLRSRFSETFVAAWGGRAEVDGFNQLVLGAGLGWRAVAVLRAYTRYLRQVGTPYTQPYIEQVLNGHPGITADLAELFHVRFDPDMFADQDTLRAGRAQQLHDRVTGALEQVTGLDADRILRTMLHLIDATGRTNVFRTDTSGNTRDFFAFKLDPSRVPGVPKPVPTHEIWVYSPRVEGVHLRFGDVARGGLRWSDRPEDFRTEILGLVKAQEVKNAVIVPVGAKGGFVVKRPPARTGDPAKDREYHLNEGIACYRTFIAALLDVTDNRVQGRIVAPERVVRHDADDPYLVVAADKGTAGFSDIANGLAVQNGFWLGDAFASGGSVGYDHKGMGITARGAWESVKYHFRELGVDTQAQEFSCVGVGDMSGDVFGNGMLLSQHVRLIAAFDHRHIFVDPAPDAGESFVERMRLFELPRSSWTDYDPALISPGGGVWPRTAKSVPISPQMRAVLGLGEQVSALTPTELIRAILLAPVDLLWNGGIGTYVKASTETNAEVGDKANDAVRVNGRDLRVKVVGEGGNLGVTQLGRIEFARSGGRINTDAIDNSAGVDTSDREVNIKIALQQRLERGELDEPGRRELLASMTDEVADLVLADNIGQNRVLGVARLHAPAMLSVHARLIDSLVVSGRLDRELEFAPSSAEIAARTSAGEGLTSPELSVLLAYVKSSLAASMLSGDLPDDPAYTARLLDYFPRHMRTDPASVAAITGHPLARQIITAQVVNDMVDRAGITYAFRLEEELAAGPEDAIRAYTVATRVFGLDAVFAEIDALTELPLENRNALILRARRTLDRVARWLLTRRPQPLDADAEINRYDTQVRVLLPQLDRWLEGADAKAYATEIDVLQLMGTPPALASTLAYGLQAFVLLDAVDIAEESGRDVHECAELLYKVSARYGFTPMLTSITGLPRGDRWHMLARQALRDDLYQSLRALTARVLSVTSPQQDPEDKVRQWEERNSARLARTRTALMDIANVHEQDLAILSVAARKIKQMIG